MSLHSSRSSRDQGICRRVIAQVHAREPIRSICRRMGWSKPKALRVIRDLANAGRINADVRPRIAPRPRLSAAARVQCVCGAAKGAHPTKACRSFFEAGT